MATDDFKDVFLLGTPQEIGIAIQEFNSQFPERPFGVGPIRATRNSPFDMRIDPAANPVTVSIGDSHKTIGHVTIYARPGGAIMSLRTKEKDRPAVLIYWQPLQKELRRLGFIESNHKFYDRLPARSEQDLSDPYRRVIDIYEDQARRQARDLRQALEDAPFEALRAKTLEDPEEAQQVTRQMQLKGEHPCKATFYLDNTTARDAATWLSTNWSVSHPEKPDIWTFPDHFEMTRAFQAMPVIETMDDRGRHLLTIGINERTAGGLLKPFSVSDAGAINSRGIEILVIPVATTQTQVIAACNALLLLDSFTDLLWHTKTAYGDNLRLVQRSFRVMDTPLFEDDPIAAEYFKKMNARFDAMLEAIEPPLAYLQPQNDGAHTAVNEPARDDEPAVNETPRDDPPTAKYPYSLTAERESLLRERWNDDSLTYEDIANELGVTIERLKDFKPMYQLRDRKRGRKPSK